MEYFTVKDGIRIKHIIQFQVAKEPVMKNKKKKSSKNYPQEFIKKRKVILQGGFCTECGSNEYLQVHHINKNIFDNEDSNLKLLCYNCHSKYHSHMRGQSPEKWMKK